MPVSSVRRSTARLPSSAAEPLPRAGTAPLTAVVLASKVAPIVIGQITRTSPGPTRHVPAAATVAPTRLSKSRVDFITGSSPAIQWIATLADVSSARRAVFATRASDRADLSSIGRRVSRRRLDGADHRRVNRAVVPAAAPVDRHRLTRRARTQVTRVQRPIVQDHPVGDAV